MATKRRKPQPTLEYDYVARTRSWPVNLLFLMPWLVIYELALFGSQSPVDNAAAAWLRALGNSFGRQGLLLITLVACLILAICVLVRIRDATKDGGIFGGMAVEGLVYGALLGTVAGLMATTMPMERMAGDASITIQPADAPLALQEMKFRVQELGLAIGAGIFEELVFRGFLCFGLFMIVRHVLGADRLTAGLLAVVVSAYIFSDYHHWGITGEVYDAHVFAFRFHAGVILGVIFLTRGLGIAAFAHGFYDVLVTLGT